MFTDPTGEVGFLGAGLGGLGDLAWQTIVEGKSLRCVDWGEVLKSAALGAAGVGLAKLGHRAWKFRKFHRKSMKAKNASRRYRRADKVPPTHDAHHWAIGKKSQASNAVKNHPLNLNPIPRNVHQRITGNSLEKPFGPVSRWWHGHPGWTKDLEGAAGLAAAGLASPEGGGCGCPN